MVVLCGACTAAALPYFDLSRPDGGLRVRSHELADEADALLGLPATLAREQRRLLGRALVASAAADADAVPRQTEPAWELSVVFLTANGEPVFTPDRLEFMSGVENAILSDPQYDRFCLRDEATRRCAPHRTPTAWFSNFTETAIAAGLRRMRALRDRPQTDWFFPSNVVDGDGDVVQANRTRLQFRFGQPLEGYLDSDDRATEQFDQFQQWIVQFLPILDDEGSGAARVDLDVLWFGDGVYIHRALEIMGTDLALIGASIGAVYLFMAVRMGLLRAALGLIQVLLSFPVTLFLYRVVLGVKLFGALNVLSVFIVLGIGADDVFVLYDAFLQAPRDRSLVARLHFALWRASQTMLASSVMSVLAFAFAASSLVPAIQYFGVFTALLVTVNFVLVITFFAAGLVVSERVTCSSSCPTFVHTTTQSQHRQQHQQQEPWSRFCGGPFAQFVRRFRWWLLILSAVAVASLLSQAARMEVAERTFSFWPARHQFARFEQAADSFAGPGDIVKVFVPVGVERQMNRSGTDSTDIDDVGKAVLVPRETGRFDDERTQLALATLCGAMRAAADRLWIRRSAITGDPEIACFWDELAAWRRARLEPFPVAAASFDEVARDFLGRAYAARRLGPFTGFVSGLLRSTVIVANTTAAATADAEERAAVYSRWTGFLANFTASPLQLPLLLESLDQHTRCVHGAPSCASPRNVPAQQQHFLNLWDEQLRQWAQFSGLLDEPPRLPFPLFPTAPWFFLWGATIGNFQLGAFSSLAFATVAVLVLVLAFSRCSVRLAGLSVLATGAVVAVVLGVMVTLDWRLGSLEAVNITILVGLSADYIVHFLFSIHEAESRK